MAAGAPAAPAEPLRHATKENGDCPHWCRACAAEAALRELQIGDQVAIGLWVYTLLKGRSRVVVPAIVRDVLSTGAVIVSWEWRGREEVRTMPRDRILPASLAGRGRG